MLMRCLKHKQNSIVATEKPKSFMSLFVPTGGIKVLIKVLLCIVVLNTHSHAPSPELYMRTNSDQITTERTDTQ